MTIAPLTFQTSFVIEKRITTTDEGLVAACRRGEDEAWNMLVDRYQRLIYSIPRRAGLDEDRAAEVFQHTFTKMLEYLDRIEQPGCIHAWLVTTARHETLRQIRLRNAEQSMLDIDEPDHEDEYISVSDDDPLPEELVTRLEEQHMIRLALESMDNRCRQLLTMLFYRSEPLSYTEAAAALEMPEGSLGPTRARCLHKLRNLLEKSEI